MSRFKCIVWLWGVISLMSVSCHGQSFDFSAQRILIISNGDKESVEAADYLYRHLDKRNRDKGQFQITRSDVASDGFTGAILYVEVVTDLSSDYEIKNEGGQLSLFGKNRSTLRWLAYMLIDKLADYHNLDVADIPPYYLDFVTSKRDFALTYRDPHLRPNMDQDISGILLTHNVDRDWGLWGHNLKKVFTDGPDENSQALVAGKRDPEQYCFSSEDTFRAIKAFVLEEYGRNNRGARWFMIAPNDNDKVCNCASCRKHGNTPERATGAVIALLNRLTKEFPQDYFYTTAYRTTREAPEVRLGDRAGVLVSTIDLPKSPRLDTDLGSVREFNQLLEAWKKQTKHIYLWDYISNFDDYISPFPVLSRVQEQLTYFRQLGVNGVFLNGSGYDYAPFDDVKTYVLSALMIDPTLSVSELVKKYYERFYPISGGVLTQYVMDMENRMYSRNQDIHIYTSFREAMESYIDTERFKTLYSQLEGLEHKLKDGEKQRVKLLIDALSYTRLQLDYHNGSIANGFFTVRDGEVVLSNRSDATLGRLIQAMKEGVINYKEEKGDLSTYLEEWNKIKARRVAINKFVVIKALGLESGEELKEGALLCDNKAGFASDFNQGWFLAGEDVVVKGQVATGKKGAMHLKMNFLLNTKHRMHVPVRVEIWSEGNRVLQFASEDLAVEGNLAVLKKDVDLSKYNEFEIKIYKNKALKNAVIACDEIHLY